MLHVETNVLSPAAKIKNKFTHKMIKQQQQKTAMGKKCY